MALLGSAATLPASIPPVWVLAMATADCPMDRIEGVKTTHVQHNRENIMKIRTALAAPLLTAGRSGIDAGTAVVTAGPLWPMAPLRPRWTRPTPSQEKRAHRSATRSMGADPWCPTAPTLSSDHAGSRHRNHDEGVTSNGEVDLPF